jgi:hypothetical protein
MEPPRHRNQRLADTRARLRSDVDVWVATAGADGAPYLVPLSLDWDGEHVIVCAQRTSRTIENMLRSGVARLGLGPTRDVVMIDAVLDTLYPAAEVSAALAEHYAHRTGWDPRQERGDYVYVSLRPTRIHAWREANELPGRTIMRNGEWL